MATTGPAPPATPPRPPGGVSRPQRAPPRARHGRGWHFPPTGQLCRYVISAGRSAAPLALPARAQAVHGGGSTLGLVLGPGIPAPRDEAGAPDAATGAGTGALPPPPQSAAMLCDVMGVSAELGNLLASSCQSASGAALRPALMTYLQSWPVGGKCHPRP